jgi:serine/threonine protein kinase
MRWRSRSKIARAGRVIAERYRLEAPLGRGAMGEIWSAEHVRLKSRVAIKFLDASIADDPEMLDRFLREAQSAAAVRSTHVVQIFDCGVEGRSPYISMELLKGESLDTRLYAQGRLTPAELDKIFGEVALAIGNAHNLGVIHRDLKPGNIFLAREGDLEITKVLDFGIAKVMSQTLRLSTGKGTRTGTLLGTPNYMSPEQCRGARDLDQSTDLWSLAIIAFECLTGHQPFAGESIGDVVVQICTESPLLPSSLGDVPAGFDEWFLKGASKQPSERFGSAREMAEALSAVLARHPVTTTIQAGSSPEAAYEPMTLHSMTVPLVPRPPLPASPGAPLLASSSSLASAASGSPASGSPAIARSPLAARPASSETGPLTAAFEAWLRTGNGRLRALFSALLAWARRERTWLAALRSPARLRAAIQRNFSPPAAERQHPERLAFSLTLTLLCGSVLMVFWYGAAKRPAAPAFSLSPEESVAAAARPSEDAFELRHAPLPEDASGGADGTSGSPAAAPVAPDVALPDATPAPARAARRVPANPARASAVSPRPATSGARPASVATRPPGSTEKQAPRPVPAPDAETPALPAAPSKRSAPDPFADRL